MSSTRRWQTERAQLLDSDEFRATIQKAVGKEIIGSGKQFDSEAVATPIVDIVTSELSEPSKGTHIGTMLSALGALAGFSAQMAIREHFIRTGMISEEKAFLKVTAKDGSTFYFGDMLNEALVVVKYSVWSFVGGAAQGLGAKELPDVREIFTHVASSAGSVHFGVPRLPPENMPHEAPIELLNKFWNLIRNHLAISVNNPSSWPFVSGHAAQIAMIRAKENINPGLAAKIVMESVVPMSKIDPVRVQHAYLTT